MKEPGGAGGDADTGEAFNVISKAGEGGKPIIAVLAKFKGACVVSYSELVAWLYTLNVMDSFETPLTVKKATYEPYKPVPSNKKLDARHPSLVKAPISIWVLFTGEPPSITTTATCI